jgi:hypothetical protein
MMKIKRGCKDPEKDLWEVRPDLDLDVFIIAPAKCESVEDRPFEMFSRAKEIIEVDQSFAIPHKLEVVDGSSWIILYQKDDATLDEMEQIFNFYYEKPNRTCSSLEIYCDTPLFHYCENTIVREFFNDILSIRVADVSSKRQEYLMKICIRSDIFMPRVKYASDNKELFELNLPLLLSYIKEVEKVLNYDFDMDAIIVPVEYQLSMDWDTLIKGLNELREKYDER